MSRNGVLCLQKVIFSYSPNMGSPGVRQFFALYLPSFNQKYPEVEVEIRPRFWPETSVTGVYRDGSEKCYSVKYLSPMGIAIRLNKLVNEGNDSSLPFSAAHLHYQRRSVQGTWNPWLWLFEGGRVRSNNVPSWDRKLTEKEWDFFVDKYHKEMMSEENSINERVQRFTQIPDEKTLEVQKRWKEFVFPSMQTDMEHNIKYWKEQHLKGGAKPQKSTLDEYMLFAVPDNSSLGQDAIDILRRRETQKVEEWWRSRSDQLKAP